MPEYDKKKIYALAALIVIAAAIIAFTITYAVITERGRSREKLLYNAVKQKESEGDDYFYIQNDFARAEASYLEAENMAQGLGEDYAHIKMRLQEKLASDEIKKYKDGYILFEGKWVKPSEMSVEEKLRLEKIKELNKEIEENADNRKISAEDELKLDK